MCHPLKILPPGAKSYTGKLCRGGRGRFLDSAAARVDTERGRKVGRTSGDLGLGSEALEEGLRVQSLGPLVEIALVKNLMLHLVDA